MGFKDIENIIVKYLTNEATISDLDFLSKWIERPGNEQLFEKYVKIHYEVRLAMNKPDVDRLKNRLVRRMKRDKNPFYKYKIGSVLKYAAVLMVLIGLSYLYQTNTEKIQEEKTSTLGNEVLVSKEDLITIELSDGTIQTIDTAGNKTLKDAKGNVVGNQEKSQLTYVASKAIQEIRYNTLNIPHGKQFDLVLSDGTRIILNSGTSIKYPTKFIDGKTRNVFMSGEAYFEVAKDKKNPFIVHTGEMKVRVLGTKFNLSHYSEDDTAHAVLVEGAVKVFEATAQQENMTILKPGYKAEWSKLNAKIAVENVDTRVYTAWIDGKLIFRNASFKYIRNSLARHFNVTIENNNIDLDSQLFDATFDIESLNEILETFSKSYAIDYRIENNKVIIN